MGLTGEMNLRWLAVVQDEQELSTPCTSLLVVVTERSLVADVASRMVQCEPFAGEVLSALVTL